MNQVVFVMLACVPTAWLLWRRGWIDRRRRFGVILAIVTVVYFVALRSLPERAARQSDNIANPPPPLPSASQPSGRN
jgi:hypothetical protein